MKFKRIVCVLCGATKPKYTIDDKAHCNYCIAKIIKDTKTNNKQNITGLSSQDLKECQEAAEFLARE